jgi:hypothetical protein
MSTTSSPVAGKIGQAMNFTKNTAECISTNTSGSLTAPYTVSSWVMPMDPTANITFVASRGVSEDHGLDIKFTAGNAIHADIGDGSQWLDTGADTSFNYSIGKWYHITYVVTATTYTIYANGVAIKGPTTFAVNPGTALLFDSTHPFVMGNYKCGFEEPFKGRIDDVRIYNRALSATEIKQLYNMGR